MADETPVKPKVEGDVLTITVKDQQGHEVQFKIKSTTSFEKVLKAYTSRRSVDEKAYRLLFDGNPVHSDKTPKDYGMEDGDCIDAMMTQVGGCKPAVV